MYVPQNFFDKFHTERLLLMGERTKFAEYVEHQKQMTMLDKIKESLASIWPPTHEEVEATVWYRHSGIVGIDIIRVSMPYRKWMSGTVLVEALITEFDKRQKGLFLKGKPASEYSNKRGIHEFIMLGDPRTGKRYWNFLK